MGLADDVRPLAWQVRLGWQAGIAVLAVTSCPPPMKEWVWVIGVVWLVALINAFNMLDNMDTLSGGVALISSGFLAIALGFPRGMAFPLLGAALVGFLYFNRPPARIFMGDVGSLFWYIQDRGKRQAHRSSSAQVLVANYTALRSETK